MHGSVVAFSVTKPACNIRLWTSSATSSRDVLGSIDGIAAGHRVQAVAVLRRESLSSSSRTTSEYW